jgi:hypothetical protein
MTQLGLLYLQAREYEKWREEVGLTTEGFKRAVAAYKKSRKEGTLGERDMRRMNPDKVFMGPILIIWHDSDSDFDIDSEICGSLVLSQWFRNGKRQSVATLLGLQSSTMELRSLTGGLGINSVLPAITRGGMLLLPPRRH